jgi:hypothetical protein
MNIQKPILKTKQTAIVNAKTVIVNDTKILNSNSVKSIRNDSTYLLNMFSSVNQQNLSSPTIDINRANVRFSKQDLYGLVRKSGIIRRSIYEYPKTACSTWISLNYGKKTKENPEDVLKCLKDIPFYMFGKSSPEGCGTRGAFQMASGLARKFGSAYIVLGIADNQDLSQPIDWKKIKSIDWFKVYDCWQLQFFPAMIDFEIKQKSYNTPQRNNEDYFLFYGVRIHPSRVLSFYGNRLDSLEELLETSFFHDSVILSFFEVFSNWLNGNKGVAQSLLTSSMYKMGITELGDLIRQDIETETSTNQQYIQNRAQSIKAGMSSMGLLLFDKALEELDTVNRNMSGNKEALEALKDSFAANSDLPRWKLFNELGSSSMGSTEQAVQMARYEWAFAVNDWQYQNFLSPLDYLIKLQMSAKCMYGNIIDAYTENSIKFPLAVQMTQTELLEVQKLAAERDQILSNIKDDQGVISKSEIRQQYLTATFDPNIQLDH